MLKDYLIDIASSGSGKDLQQLISAFLNEWKEVIEECGFAVDANGYIVEAPETLLDYHKRVLEEYIVLRCLHSKLAMGQLKSVAEDCCKSEWECKNVSSDINSQCKNILQSVSEKLGNPAGAA